MAKYSVEIFGLPYEITDFRAMQLELKDGATLRDVVAALGRKIPALKDVVICTGQDQLTELYMFNVNGRFYSGNDELQLKDGDHIRLLRIASGG